MKRLIGTLVGVISLGLGLAALTPPAYGHGGDTSLIHGCLKKNGNLRIIAANVTCKPNETARDWNISGPTGPQGPAGPQGPQGPAAPPPLALYDVNGNLVGPVLSTIGTHAVDVPFRVDNHSFHLVVYQDGFRGNMSEVLFFASSDCSGPAFMDAPVAQQGHPPLFPAVIVGLDTIYIQDGPEQTVANRSNLDIITPNATCLGGPTYNGGNPDIRQNVPALLLIDNLYTHFPPPFSVH